MKNVGILMNIKYNIMSILKGDCNFRFLLSVIYCKIEEEK